MFLSQNCSDLKYVTEVKKVEGNMGGRGLAKYTGKARLTTSETCTMCIVYTPHCKFFLGGTQFERMYVLISKLSTSHTGLCPGLDSTSSHDLQNRRPVAISAAVQTAESVAAPGGAVRKTRGMGIVALDEAAVKRRSFLRSTLRKGSLKTFQGGLK